MTFFFFNYFHNFIQCHVDLAFFPLTRYEDPLCISKLHYEADVNASPLDTCTISLSLSLSHTHTPIEGRGWGAEHRTILAFPATTRNRGHDTLTQKQSIAIRYVTYSVSSDSEVFLRFASDQAVSVATNLEPFLCFEPSVPMLLAPPHVVTCNRNSISLTLESRTLPPFFPLTWLLFCACWCYLIADFCRNFH